MNKILENMPNVAPEGPLRNDRKGTNSPRPPHHPFAPRLPNSSPSHSLTLTGPLSIIGDPLGKGLEKGLAPIGHITGQVGEPSGQALLNAQNQAKEEAGYKDKMKRDDTGPGGEEIGGKEQTGKNPLGL